MNSLQHLIAGATIALVWPMMAQADVVTYFVDHEGFDTVSGNKLSVIGTIVADTDTNLLISSDMEFYHQDIYIGDLPSLPNETLGDEGVQYAWNATAATLNFERLADFDGFVRWAVEDTGVLRYEISMGIGNNPHLLSYGNPANNEDDVVILLAPSPTGSFTFANIPEPTSTSLLVLGLAGLALRRRRRD